MRLMKKTFVVCLLTCASCFAADPTAKRQPLSAFLGHWEGSGKFLQTKYSKPQTVTSTADCNWTPQGSALICEMTVHDDKGEHTQLSLDAPNTAGAGYVYYTITPGHAPFAGELKIDGNTWTYGPSVDSEDQTPQFRTSNVFSGDTESFKTEFTEDGKTWTTMLEGSMKRTNDKEKTAAK